MMTVTMATVCLVAPFSETKDLEAIFQHKLLKMLLSEGKITQDLINMLLSWPPSPLPARRAYRPEDRAYGSESDTRASTFSVAQQSIPEKKRRWPSASPPTANALHWRAGQANAGRAL